MSKSAKILNYPFKLLSEIHFVMCLSHMRRMFILFHMVNMIILYFFDYLQLRYAWVRPKYIISKLKKNSTTTTWGSIKLVLFNFLYTLLCLCQM